MKTGEEHTLLSAVLFRAAVVCVLLLVPMLAQAQVFWGWGGLTNKAPDITNVALGSGTLSHNTTGLDNTAIGNVVLFSNTTGSYNTATGLGALYLNTEGNFNTAMGYVALDLNATGYGNTAMGGAALYYNSTGNANTANGDLALFSNTTGSDNTANGFYALFSNTEGNLNTALGGNALFYNTTGMQNTATGEEALSGNTTGHHNTATGVRTLFNNETGSYNIALGYGAGYNTTGSNNIDIGNQGVAGEGGVIRIGTRGTHKATFIAGINGVTATGGAAVYINANGQLGTLPSSRRFKTSIHDMGQASNKVMQLRPVTFRYRQAAENGAHPLQYGLIAEEVARVYPDLVQYDQAGKPLAVYYHLLTPMLLNELQKEHRQAEVQKAEIAALKSEVAALKAAQQQQLNTVTQLTSLVEMSHNEAPRRQEIAIVKLSETR